MFNIKYCQWLDSNRGLLELEATALPTEPQPLPYLDVQKGAHFASIYFDLVISFWCALITPIGIKPDHMFQKVAQTVTSCQIRSHWCHALHHFCKIFIMLLAGYFRCTRLNILLHWEWSWTRAGRRTRASTTYSSATGEDFSNSFANLLVDNHFWQNILLTSKFWGY